MRYKLAILHVLANQPGGRATRDEVRRQAGLMIPRLNQIELRRFTTLGDVDIFRRGWVSRDDADLQITDEGMALLDWLRSADETTRVRSLADSADVIWPADEQLIRPGEQQLFSPNQADAVDSWRPSSAEDPQRRVASDVRHVRMPIRAVDSNRTRHFEIGQSIRRLFRSAGAVFSSTPKWRRSRTARNSSIKSLASSEGPIRSMAGAAFGLFVLLFVVASVLAAIAFGQIQSLKSDVAVLRRELLPVRERLAKFEAESQKWEDQQEEVQSRSDAEKKKADSEVRNEPAALNLTREELQLIRDYIKPALTPGIAAPEINVGDTVAGATIPLPSPLTEKIPKLQGARFTTRNGSIIIVRRNSRQAEAILSPN